LYECLQGINCDITSGGGAYSSDWTSYRVSGLVQYALCGVPRYVE